ncbi:ATP-binding protein [uncultured Clostridium sp.]|uniref:ATP-binding protein n=1 Tax=uncultured Clostridium sp. TaxID=59620 RepID=UPI0028E264C4|nr:ATP-binding protein [uncultured Clostridium sp.]
MKNSIRTKLFIQISIIILIFALLTTVINSNFLEKYYVYQKKQVLIKQGDYISELSTEDYKEMAVELRTIESRYSANISIISSEGRVKYSSSFAVINDSPYMFEKPDKEFPEEKPIKPFPREKPHEIKEREVINKNSFIELQTDKMLNGDFLVYNRELDNGDVLDIRVFLNSISESAKVANTFLFLISLILLVIGGFWAFIMANNFTKPILQMNEITRDMAALNFSKKCNIKTMDEINQLGDSINYLSEQLEQSLTELREANEELQHDIERERKIDEMRKEFISNISHELRTPISIVEAYSEGLKLNIIRDEKKKNYYCDVIMEETGKMDKLLRELLDLAQMEGEYFKLNKSEFNIKELINSCYLKYQEIFKNKKINAYIDVKEEVLVYADSFRIEQVLNNLINNAIAYIDGERVIKITCEKNKDHVKVSIFNTGPQIPKDELDKLWISFYKTDKSRNRGKGGYGLGLSIVRAIQQLHGSDYGAENLEDGVVFWFHIKNVVE